MFKPEVLAAIEDKFKERLRHAHGIDPTDKKKVGQVKAMTLQTEFFAGAMAALAQFSEPPALPPQWIISLMSGRSIV